MLQSQRPQKQRLKDKDEEVFRRLGSLTQQNKFQQLQQSEAAMLPSAGGETAGESNLLHTQQSSADTRHQNSPTVLTDSVCGCS